MTSILHNVGIEKLSLLSCVETTFVGFGKDHSRRVQFVGRDAKKVKKMLVHYVDIDDLDVGHWVTVSLSPSIMLPSSLIRSLQAFGDWIEP